MNKYIYFLIGILLLGSCSADKQVSLDYTLINFKLQTPECEPEKDACLMVSIKYPQFNKGDSLAMILANRIAKNSILDNISMGDAESLAEPSIEEAVEGLHQSFEEVKKDFNSYSTGWQADIETKELYRTDSILVLEIASMTFMGGAHANQNVRYFNFNRTSGRFLPITSFIENMDEFTARAETEFKKVYKIADGVTYDEAGFNFLGNKFLVSANYAFLGDSIKLHYNHYEISSYAAGDFEITVSVE